MKARICLMLILLIFVSLVLFKNWERSHIGKWAIKTDDFSEFEDYIIVRETYHTGTGWEIIADNNSYYASGEIQDIIISPRLPGGRYPEPQNTFLCIVNHEGKRLHEASRTEYDCYDIIEWYPVYPVRRTVTLLPEFFYDKRFLREDELVSY